MLAEFSLHDTFSFVEKIAYFHILSRSEMKHSKFRFLFGNFVVYYNVYFFNAIAASFYRFIFGGRNFHFIFICNSLSIPRFGIQPLNQLEAIYNIASIIPFGVDSVGNFMFTSLILI
jgi:hypothetical protein